MSSLSEAGWLDLRQANTFFSRTVAKWYCWTNNVSAVTTRRRSTRSVKQLASCFFHGGRLPCVSVVSFRATLRVGRRYLAGHFPIWQHLGMSRQHTNITKATLRFLSFLRTLVDFATRSEFGKLAPSCFDSRHFHLTCVSFVFPRKCTRLFVPRGAVSCTSKDVLVAGIGFRTAILVECHRAGDHAQGLGVPSSGCGTAGNSGVSSATSMGLPT